MRGERLPERVDVARARSSGRRRRGGRRSGRGGGRPRSGRRAGRTRGSSGPSRCPASPSSAISTAGRWWRSAIRAATIPITPGCQSSPASTYAAAGPCSATCASAANRIRVSTSRRSALTASSSAAIAARARRILGQQQLEPGVGAVQAPGGVDPRREAEADRRRRRPRPGPRGRPPSARAARACGCRASARSPARTSARFSSTQRHDVGDRGERDQVEVLVGERRILARAPRAAPARACARPPVAHSSGHGLPPSRGCTIGASGSAPSARGVWWSVTTTSSPAARAAATSSTAVIAQSTVTSRSVPRAASRSTVAGGEPVAVVDPARQVPVDVGAERAQRAHEHGGRGHAVDVVVAVDGDPRPRAATWPRIRSAAARRPPNASSGCASAPARNARAAAGVSQPAAHQHLRERRARRRARPLSRSAAA